MTELFENARPLADLLVASGARERQNHSAHQRSLGILGLRTLLTGILDFEHAKNFTALLDIAFAGAGLSRLLGRNLVRPIGGEDDGESSDADGKVAKRKVFDVKTQTENDSASARSRAFVTAEGDVGRLMFLGGPGFDNADSQSVGKCGDAVGQRISDIALAHLTNPPTVDSDDVGRDHGMTVTKLYWRTVVAAASEKWVAFYYNLSMLGEKVRSAAALSF
jgi:hypothetical protein